MKKILDEGETPPPATMRDMLIRAATIKYNRMSDHEIITEYNGNIAGCKSEEHN